MSGIDGMLREMRRAYDLVEEHQASAAVRVYRELVARARRAGLDSAQLHWAYAVACERAGDLETAFDAITLAIARDPRALPLRAALDAITRRIRARLAEDGLAPDDPAVPRLYALLLCCDGADVASHLAMARHHLATGRPAEARALAAAVALLHPTARAAFEVEAAAAAAAGDAAGAERARERAAALAPGDAPAARPPERSPSSPCARAALDGARA